ncbi:RNA helicase [Lysinibacillus sp. 2017]|uniref:DEAD/DEAH box helicase n=1 Tax=unclassified Lysinibacillus TaxID=2636778 RepID=UPI000D52A2CF|nr:MULTISPECIES: DEAD/DEAH box helicase [unclassified Lysinibacillus]AWE08270.1 RNA helicase [Lysinibacillus sp. 2017]TGN36227.1 DEAD/DEAH box helicase [Lysinibacillus sp. S2017]
MPNEFKQFELSQEIIGALRDLDYSAPTEVQKKVLPHALQEKDLIVKAQTGSGKTAAFAIPICEKIDWIENKPQALVLTPTRELAVQVKEEFTNIGRYKRVKAAALYGKQPFRYQQDELKQKTHVVVGTPGRVLDHIEKGTLKLEKIRYLVIDEADEMLNMGFIEQVEAILSHLPKERVTMLFSATVPETIKTLSSRYLKEPMDIEVHTEEAAPKIEHGVMEVPDGEKMSTLEKVVVVENPDTCIIFCRTKDRVDEIHDRLYDREYSVDKLHGGMEQSTRLLVMNDFKRGDFRYLVATDVAARGIDIENISLVINFDLPMEKEAYVHRTGRTGRAGLEGKAITFVTPHEYDFLAGLEEFVGFKIPQMAIPTHEEVEANADAFDKKMQARPQKKKQKSAKVDAKIMKLYFNGGKKKKLRAVDFVGTLAKIPGMTADDIGIITILDASTFVEILNGKGNLVLKAMKTTPIKGKQLKVNISTSK